MRVFCIIITLCVCVLVFIAGCGKSAHKSTRALPAVTNEQASAPRDIEGILDEIDGYQPPAGVDSQLFEKMRVQLRKGILSNSSSRIVSALDDEDWLNINTINDLKLSSLPSEPVKLTWGYHNLGDYSQNGLVEISDITPLAQNYNQTWSGGATEDEYNLMPAVGDGILR